MKGFLTVFITALLTANVCTLSINATGADNSSYSATDVAGGAQALGYEYERASVDPSGAPDGSNTADGAVTSPESGAPDGSNTADGAVTSHNAEAVGATVSSFGADGVTEGDGADAETEDEENGDESHAVSSNLFEELYKGVLKHAEKIFSLLSFAVSLLLSIAYKKGLTPAMTAGISDIGCAVSGLQDKSERAVSELADRLKGLEGTIASYGERIASLSEGLISEGEMSAEREKLRQALLGQTDMLYEIFMTSSLPQFEKEAVSKRIAALKEAIGNEEEK